MVKVGKQSRLLVLVIVLAAMLFSTTLASAAASKTLTGTLTIYAAQYTPAEPTKDNPHPPTYLKKIVAAYEKLHPGVKIVLLPNTNPSSEAFAQWKYTQFAGGTIPDVIYNNPFLANNEVSKGWYVPLDQYLSEPNPYVKGNKRWADVLKPGTLDSTLNVNGKQYNLPLDAIDTAIFYNKDMFKKAGINSIPKTWAEFIEASAKLKAAGFTPFFFNMGPNGRDYTDWFERQLMDMLYKSSAKELLALTGGVPKASQLTPIQVAEAIKAGKFGPDDPRFQEAWKILKDFSQYWQEGFTGAQVRDYQRYFIDQKVAMFEGTTGDVKILNDELKPSFEWGTFQAIPPLTKETAKYADGTAAGRIGIIGAFADYNVTKGAKDRGNLALAVDFLKFLSAPQNSGPMIQELGYFVPMVKGVALPSQLEPFIPSVARPDCLLPGFVSRLTVQDADQYYRTLQMYILDQITLEQAMKQVAKDYEPAITQVLGQK